MPSIRTYRFGFRGTALAVALTALIYAQVPAPLDPLSLKGPNPAERFSAIEIQQNLDAQAPLGLHFTDQDGRDVTLGEYVGDRPALLALVYYQCPMLCNQMLNGLEIALGAMKYKVGEDFNVITVSIDPNETPDLANAKRASYLEQLNQPGAEAGWNFLVGTKENIDALAGTVGYRYVLDPATGQYVHAAGIMALTPQGRISHYFYGVDYIPRDVEFGLIQASEGKIGNLVDKVILLCYLYDPTSGKYGFYVIGAMRIGAVLMVVGLLTFWIVDWRQNRRKAAAALILATEAKSGASAP